jgi:hypothetical protein
MRLGGRACYPAGAVLVGDLARMPSRLLIAYALLALLLVGLLAFTALAIRRRRAEHDLRWRNRKGWRRRS